jgi:hypothetical protein
MQLLRKNQLTMPALLSKKSRRVDNKTPIPQCHLVAILYRLDQMEELFLQDNRSQPMPEEQHKTQMLEQTHPHVQ